MVGSTMQPFKILSSSFSLSFQPEAISQIFFPPSISLDLGHSSRICLYPYLENPPAGPTPEAGSPK